MLTDNDRLELYQALRDKLGERPATLFMTTVSPHDPDSLVTNASMTAAIDQLRAEFKSEMTALTHRLFWVNLGSMIGLAGLVLAAQSVN
jgi:hypothetical protein